MKSVGEKGTRVVGYEPKVGEEIDPVHTRVVKESQVEFRVEEVPLEGLPGCSRIRWEET